MGSMPYRRYDVCKKKLGVRWRLVDKISPAFELSNSGVPEVARSFQLSSIAWVLNEQARVFLGCRPVTAYHHANASQSGEYKGVPIHPRIKEVLELFECKVQRRDNDEVLARTKGILEKITN